MNKAELMAAANPSLRDVSNPGKFVPFFPFSFFSCFLGVETDQMISYNERKKQKKGGKKTRKMEKDEITKIMVLAFLQKILEVGLMSSPLLHLPNLTNFDHLGTLFPHLLRLRREFFYRFHSLLLISL